MANVVRIDGGKREYIFDNGERVPFANREAFANARSRTTGVVIEKAKPTPVQVTKFEQVKPEPAKPVEEQRKPADRKGWRK